MIGAVLIALAVFMLIFLLDFCFSVGFAQLLVNLYMRWF